MLLTSHDLAEADALADRVVVMDQGCIVADDTPGAIRAQAGESAIRCRTGMAVAAARAMPAVREAETEGAELRIVTGDASATLRHLLDADRTVSDLRVGDTTLEDAIAALLAPSERIAA